ncbi:DoxX family protein [Trujillonella endophytica]|uniref:Putative oxidoreductase n=1 Tax=Trujillonella endophytica TaxID=673521 RepID=A0A1H8V6M6_9ACTN|nr:DoxX family protein [Trujillella endophytica]SEP10874.1 putative oxidoreductase [Trujillella endophytica]
MDSALDLGLFIVRLALGPMLILHGYNKVFGSGGLEGTTRWFAGLGLKPAWLHARIAPVNEIGAGLLLTLGLLTPLACAAFVGLMTVASLTDHRGKGYFVFKGGWEYTLLVGMVAVGLAAMGPGDWSLDHAFGWEPQGWGWALGAAVVGVVAAAGLLAVSYRPEKKDAEPVPASEP